jgi:hypothetical protein
MMRNLLVEEGGLVQVDNVSLSVATFAKFQPQSPDFLDITNPKAVYPSNCWSCPTHPSRTLQKKKKRERDV